MRCSLLTTIIITICLALPLATGCQTGQPGVKTTGIAQYTSLAANLADATEAAATALEDLKLERVNSQSGAVEGWARGYMADGTEVEVELEDAGSGVTDVTVNVGTFGDTALGREIIARMQEELGLERTAAAR